MSSILSRAKAHYETKDGNQIEVPEWGDKGKPLVVTWSPLTVAERRKIYEPVNGESPDGGLVVVRTVIRKARDAGGKPLFTAMDEHELMHKVDGSIVGRIANAILFGAGLAKADGGTQPIDDAVDDAGNA